MSQPMNQPMNHPRSLSTALLRTPTRTLLREWFSRSHHTELLAQSGLPTAVCDRISWIVRRARLWPSEQRDVTRELIAHFADGLQSGQLPESLLADFGDPAATAKLILRSKRRGRPAWWRAAHWVILGCGMLVLCLLALYGLLAIRYAFASPTITRNFAQELNTKIDAIPPSDRAAPYYARLLALKPFDSIQDEALKQVYPDVMPGEPAWPAAVDFHARHRELVALAREAASKPAVGLRYTNEIAGDFLPLDPTTGKPIAQGTPDPNPPMDSILLPHLAQMRHAARLLALDLRVALSEGDASRIAPTIESMLSIRDQAGREPFLISLLVAQAIEALAVRELCVALHESPALLGDDPLVSLAHRLTAWDAIEGYTRALNSERDGVLDVLQRCFTDDGSGDGVLTPEGFKFLYAAISDTRKTPAVERVLLPGYAQFIAGRREQLRKYDELLAAARADLATPIWQLRADSTITGLESMDKLDRARYAVITALYPALGKARRTLEAGLQHREVALTAIALELHKRRHGRYPGSLLDLSKTLLPRTPIDRFDGQMLRYTLRDDRPILYSVGPDALDNRATPALPESSFNQHLAAHQTAGAATPSGDIVLYPVARRVAAP